MPPDRFLDLFDEDLLAAAVDDQRVAAEQDDGAVGSEGAAVARHREAAPVDDGKRLLSALRIVQVAEWDAAGAYDPAGVAVSRLEEARAVGRQHRGARRRLELLRLRAPLVDAPKAIPPVSDAP